MALHSGRNEANLLSTGGMASTRAKDLAGKSASSRKKVLRKFLFLRVDIMTEKELSGSKGAEGREFINLLFRKRIIRKRAALLGKPEIALAHLKKDLNILHESSCNRHYTNPAFTRTFQAETRTITAFLPEKVRIKLLT